MTDLATLHEAHARRVLGLDAAARTAPLALPTPASEADAQDDGQVIVQADGQAVVLVDVDATDPASTASLWVADRVARLRVRAATDAAAAGVLPLLRRAVAAAPDDLEVHVTVAARDLTLVRPLLDAGFAAATVLAVRRPAAGPATAIPVDDLVVRPADPASAADAAALTDQRVRLQRFETSVSLVPVRADSEPLVREAVAEQLHERPGWSWLAERDGRVVGGCEVLPPGHADWAAGATTADRAEVAYLQDLHVASDGRGAGVGTALVAAAHEALAAAGATTVLLHHGATNPLSAPFWARAGYRPLHTTWIRVPRG